MVRVENWPFGSVRVQSRPIKIQLLMSCIVLIGLEGGSLVISWIGAFVLNKKGLSMQPSNQRVILLFFLFGNDIVSYLIYWTVNIWWFLNWSVTCLWSLLHCIGYFCFWMVNGLSKSEHKGMKNMRYTYCGSVASMHLLLRVNQSEHRLAISDTIDSTDSNALQIATKMSDYGNNVMRMHCNL